MYLNITEKHIAPTKSILQSWAQVPNTVHRPNLRSGIHRSGVRTLTTSLIRSATDPGSLPGFGIRRRPNLHRWNIRTSPEREHLLSHTDHVVHWLSLRLLPRAVRQLSNLCSCVSCNTRFLHSHFYIHARVALLLDHEGKKRRGQTSSILAEGRKRSKWWVQGNRSHDRKRGLWTRYINPFLTQ